MQSARPRHAGRWLIRMTVRLLSSSRFSLMKLTSPSGSTWRWPHRGSGLPGLVGGAGQRKTLFLSFKELDALIAGEGIVTPWQLLNEFEGVRCSSRLFDCLLASPRSTEEDILCNGTVLQQDLLLYQTDRGAQAVDRDLPDIDAVDKNHPLERLGKAHNEVGNGAFTRTARPGNCHCLTLGDLEI